MSLFLGQTMLSGLPSEQEAMLSFQWFNSMCPAVEFVGVINITRTDLICVH